MPDSILTSRGFVWVVGLLLLAPLAFRQGSRPIIHLGLPQVCSGDEPHYLVLLSSVLEDGDLELGNNYRSAREGSLQAGRAFAGQPLDHHTVPGAAEYSQHPPGQAFLLAPLLFPLRGSRWVEPAALLCSGLAVVLAMLALRALAARLTGDAAALNLGVALALLGSPAWHYGRTLFSEPYLLALAAGAYALALLRARPFLAGLLLAAGMQMKPPFAVLVVPLLVASLRRRDWAGAGRLLAAPVASLLVLLALNQWMFGSPFTTAQPVGFGDLFGGARGLLFSQGHGLLPFSPVALVSVLGWRSALRSHRALAAPVLSGVLLYFLVMASWPIWDGGHCYGPRLVMPVVPLLLLGAVKTLERPRSRWLAGACLALGLLSVAINLAGALFSCAFWEAHPLVAGFQLLAGELRWQLR
ncbi:MAG: hypothetical protein HYZ28_25085 [Myxococcales bacterium]|nr:hypothetical protein [Myxococcales bacterium]